MSIGVYDWAILVAGACVILATALSLHLINEHLSNYINPQRQRYIIRIILMVPVYATESFMSLCMPSLSMLFDVPRDVYEAFVIYTFVELMIDCMGGEDVAQAFFATSNHPQKHWWPFRWMGVHNMEVFLATCRLCTLQYSLVRPITAVISLITAFSGEYDDSDLNYDSAYLWILIVNNASVTLAIYYLVYFYHATIPCEELQKSRPFAKFLAIKGIVFFMFWQGMFINMLGTFGVINRSLAHRSKSSTLTGLTDFIVCLEMAVFAIVHLHVFSARDFKLTKMARPPTLVKFPVKSGPSSEQPASLETPPVRAMAWRDAVSDMFYVGDILTDIKRILREAPNVIYSGLVEVRRAHDRRRQQRELTRLELSETTKVEQPGDDDVFNDDEFNQPELDDVNQQIELPTFHPHQATPPSPTTNGGNGGNATALSHSAGATAPRRSSGEWWATV